ncbi:ABC transporter permease [Roseomonas sp. NAR14]|uniref:ABC transporter permease n=1 Tax=Roseomonas acroporae TaxID=2937791 RepID=A0A9X1Y789_9PROT|nr:ABC transporter permease [Roseomonas acroporae]MCK8784405.1 ABC transporter permease [Roseomonas acroporae]
MSPEAAHRWRRRMAALLPPALFLAAVLSLWELAARRLGLDPLILPAPTDILAQLLAGFRSGLYPVHLGVTLLQAGLGFVLAVAAGVGLGALVARSPLLERTLNPFLIAFEAMPKIALAPLVIVWFGYGIGSKVVLAAAIAFFPVLVSTILGLRACEPGRIDVLRALGATPGQIFRLARLPSALPYIFAGVNVAVVFVLLGSIVGEFVGAKQGLGTLILYANENLETAQTFSILAVLAALGLLLHLGVEALRRRLLFWAEPVELPRA